MNQSNKVVHQNSFIFALIFGATYLPAVLLLKHQVFSLPISLLIVMAPMITFALFILKYIKSVSVMDEVKQRVQFEAVVTGFSLTLILIMLLFLLSLCGIAHSHWFSYSYLVGYCWLFYFVGWFISKRKYGI